ncbi:MAG TPA: bestrophin family ion channel [Flavobacteriales bacterium]|nr:bestrophin family ion channel [Flavobacteriales bacterium]
MIKYNPKIWLSHIFKFYKSDTLKILAPEILLMGVYTTVICLVEMNYSDDLTPFKNAIAMHTMVGFVLSLLLVFRTNTAYDRWWEGRKLWGQLVNTSRNSAVKCQYIVKDIEAREKLQKLITAFPIVLKDHLLNKIGDEYTIENVAINDSRIHHPSVIVTKIYTILKAQADTNKITPEEFLMLDREFSQLLEIAGACERIKNTPIPFSYSIFIKKFIFIYCFTLPIGLVPDFSYWSIPFSMFIFYVLVSIEILAEEVEDPFGDDENDLPMEEFANRIKNNVNDIMK